MFFPICHLWSTSLYKITYMLAYLWLSLVFANCICIWDHLWLLQLWVTKILIRHTNVLFYSKWYWKNIHFERYFWEVHISFLRREKKHKIHTFARFLEENIKKNYLVDIHQKLLYSTLSRECNHINPTESHPWKESGKIGTNMEKFWNFWVSMQTI